MKQLAIAALIGLVLCSTATTTSAEKTSERLGYRTYREIAGGVTVLADTTLASLDRSSSYVALPIAVRLALKTPSATISRDSFTLIDAAGNKVSTAGPMEIREQHGRVQYDTNVMQSQPMQIGQQFSGDVEVPSRFYGDRNGIGTVQDRVNLAPSSWFQDIIYFPRPPAGLDGTLTLRMTSDGIPAPIDVRFPVLQADKAKPAQ